MKIEFLIIILTLFFIINTYNDNKYIELLKSWKKYYLISFYLFIGISLYLFVKKNPNEGINLFKHAQKTVQFMPFDKNSKDLFNPILNLSSFYLNQNNNTPYINNNSQYIEKIKHSGKNNIKRSVSETKKKYIAANQSWKCAHCNSQLSAWFEIDHKTRLENGGDNHINNLEALCRECHGKKTGLESML